MRRKSVLPKTVAKIRRPRAVAYTANWDAISSWVLNRDGRRCSKCGQPGTVSNKLRCHHVIPVSRGGQTIPLNLITVCDQCHAKQPGHAHLRRTFR